MVSELGFGPVASLLSAWGLGLLVKTAVLLATVLLLSWFHRRASAAARHQLLALTAPMVLLLPLIHLLVPEWNLGWFPESASGASAGSMTAAAVGSSEPTGYSSLTIILVAVWAAGAAILLSLLIVGHLLGLAAMRRAWPIEDEELEQRIDLLADRAGISKKVVVLVSDRVKVPAVLGCWSPRLVLPQSLLGTPPDDRFEAMLVHELAHIKRHDVLTQTLAQIMCCLHWPNPLVWMVERRLMIERERACDDVVLASGSKASEYAKTLMDAARTLGNTTNPVWAMTAMAQGTDFKDRVLSILDPSVRRAAPSVSRSLLSASVILLGATLLAAAQPYSLASSNEVSKAKAATALSLEVPSVLPDIEPRAAAEAAARLQRTKVVETMAAPPAQPVSRNAQGASDDKMLQTAIGDFLASLGRAVAASAPEDESAEAAAVQELLSSIGGVVKHGEDERAAKADVASALKSLSTLIDAAPSRPDRAKQQAAENIPTDGGTSKQPAGSSYTQP